MSRYENNVNMQRWVDTPDHKPYTKLITIDEDAVYNFLAHHERTLETDKLVLPPKVHDDVFKKFGYGDRYFIAPNGKFIWINCADGDPGFGHFILEVLLANANMIPKHVLNYSVPGYGMKICSPILEELGYIRILRERAIILPQRKVANIQYYALQDWIEQIGETYPFYSVVYPDATLEQIEPEDFDNFKTSKYVIGKIKNFYETYPIPVNQRRWLKDRVTNPANRREK